jgi:hypothetical protein
VNADRAIAAILTTSLLVVLALGLWLVWDAHRAVEPPAPPTAPPLPTAAPPTTPPEDIRVPPPTTAAGHRLAGTVVGGLRFAIIEDPSGSSVLYRPGEVIPGLGELVDIAEDRVTLAGSDGRFDLRLAAAPTASAAPPTVAPATPRPTRDRQRLRDRSERESSP